MSNMYGKVININKFTNGTMSTITITKRPTSTIQAYQKFWRMEPHIRHSRNCTCEAAGPVYHHQPHVQKLKSRATQVAWLRETCRHLEISDLPLFIQEKEYENG